LASVLRRWFAWVGGIMAVGGLIGALISHESSVAWFVAAGFALLWIAAIQELRSRQSEHGGQSDPDRAFRDEIEGLSKRLDHLASSDSINNPIWYLEKSSELHNLVYEALDVFLGPVEADDFANARTPNAPGGHPGLQESVSNEAQYLHLILERPGDFVFMKDWCRRQQRPDN
jgi:hypothetical protein